CRRIHTQPFEPPFRACPFQHGYPAGDTAQRLFDVQTLNRAIDIYLTQLMPMSERASREGLEKFGAKKPTHLVIFENLMDAKTVLLTANTETVYGMSHLDLKKDGPSRLRRRCSA